MVDDFIIDQYRRLNVLQMGQNSEIWEVTDGTRRYVMKLLLPEKVDDRDHRRMLFHEAAIGMKLDHPNLIRVLSCNRNKANPYIVMQYFPSTNLKLRLIRKQYSKVIRPNLRRIIREAAAGLDYFHNHNWVHRDIKPDNILVSKHGNVRVIDFALAVKSASSFAKMFARRGTTAGTRSYMSPEQIFGYPLDRRADIYSFGIMLYEIVAGKLPFVGTSYEELFRKHLRAEAPPIDPDRLVTPEFEALLVRMMAKKPDDRPKTMVDMLSDLHRIKIFKDEIDEEKAK